MEGRIRGFGPAVESGATLRVPDVPAGDALWASWHLLSDPTARYNDLGADHYQSRINRDRQARNLLRQLERLTGQKVTLQPAA
jgi:hypothetical protein